MAISAGLVSAYPLNIGVDIVGVKPISMYYYVSSEKVEAQAVGRLSVIGCANGSVWVRVLWRSAGGRSWVLRSLGEGGDVTVDVAWAVPVLWIKC